MPVPFPLGTRLPRRRYPNQLEPIEPPGAARAGSRPGLRAVDVPVSVAQQVLKGGAVLPVSVATGLRSLVRRDGAGATPTLGDRDVAGRLQRGGLLGQVGVADTKVLAEQGEVGGLRGSEDCHDGQPLRRVEDGVEAVKGRGGKRHFSRSRMPAAIAAYSRSYQETTEKEPTPAMAAASH